MRPPKSRTGVWTATLLVDDAPAVTLCRQTNAGLTMPFDLTVSDVGLIGLTEKSLPSIAATPSGGLAYQVREFLQAIAERGGAMVIVPTMTDPVALCISAHSRTGSYPYY